MATCSSCGKDAGYLHSVCKDCRNVERPTNLQVPKPLKFSDNRLRLSSAARSGNSSLGTWILGITIVLVLIAAFFIRFGNSEVARDKGVKRLAIQQCWKDYKRRSLDPATKRFVASSCEKIEDDFKLQYGVEP